MLIIGAAAGVVVLLIAAVIAVVLAVKGDDDSAATRFEAAASEFKRQYDEKSKSLRANLEEAGSRIGDPDLLAATSDARDLAAIYAEYGQAVSAIEMPAEAQPGKDELLRAVAAGKVLKANAGAFLSKAPMQRALDELWPQVSNKLLAAEAALRRALE